MSDESELSRRSFYLLFAMAQGREDLMGKAGFVPASEDVAEVENETMASAWARLHELGITHSILQAADWFTDMAVSDGTLLSMVNQDDLEELRAAGMDEDDIFDEARATVLTTAASFAVAAVHKLWSEGRVLPVQGVTT